MIISLKDVISSYAAYINKKYCLKQELFPAHNVKKQKKASVN